MPLPKFPTRNRRGPQTTRFGSAKDAVHAVLLRSARAAKLGARAGRIFKLVMCYSLLIRGPEGEELKTRHQDTLRCWVCVCLFFVGGWLVIGESLELDMRRLKVLSFQYPPLT